MRTGPGGPLILAAILIGTLLPGDAGARGDAAFARRIDSVADLLPGPVARGMPGDFLIGNDRLRVVVSAAGNPFGFARSGGNIIDAAPRGGGDHLQLIFLWLDDTFPRQAVYDSVRVMAPGGGDGPAILVAEGEDSHDPAHRITTWYEIRPGLPYLEIRTRIQRREGTGDLVDFELGDAIQWGAAERFAPGVGSDIPFRHESRWLAGIAPGTSYGYIGEGMTFASMNGKAWADPIVKTVAVPAGGSVTYTRYLVVGDGGTALIERSANEIHGVEAGSAIVRVLDRVGDRPVPGAMVEVRREAAVEGGEDGGADGVAAAPLYFARTDEDGRASFPLPRAQGRDGVAGVRVVARAPARGLSPSSRLEGDGTVLRLGRGGRLRFRIVDSRGALIPGRIGLDGIHGTPQPSLGPASRAAGAWNRFHTATGEGEIPLPPGRYVATASRGPEHSIDSRVVAIGDGATAEATFRLERVVDTAGYLSCDFHQHAANSADSGVSLEDRVTANVAEGLELMVSTDHDYITDFAPTIARLGLADRIVSIPGDEVTAGGGGHFNAFPLVRDPAAPRAGAIDPWGLEAEAIFAALREVPPGEKVIQVNHPRGGSTGYFNNHRVDIAAGTDDGKVSWEFDAIEVMNGKRVDVFERALEDWFLLLDRGRRYVATGNSDTHDIVLGESGYPRTYVRMEDGDLSAVTPAALVTALKDRRDVIVTNGPFLRMAGPGGADVGSTVTFAGREVPVTVTVRRPDWIVVDRVEVFANGERVAVLPVGPGREEIVRASVPLAGDGWIVAIARGELPMLPVLDQPPLAFTNPIWIDREGDGFDPPVAATGGEGGR